MGVTNCMIAGARERAGRFFQVSLLIFPYFHVSYT